jgi:hypothetical protein
MRATPQRDDPGSDPAASRARRAEETAARARIFSMTTDPTRRVMSLAAHRRSIGSPKSDTRAVLADYPELCAQINRSTMDTSAQHTTALEEARTRAREAMERNERLSEQEAIGLVLSKDPALYRRYTAESTAGHPLALGRGDTNSAAADELGLTPRTTPAARKGVTIEKLKPTSSGGETVPSALAIIEARTLEIMAATGCSQGDARDRAIAESPSLYAQYLQEFRQRAAGDTSD